MAAVSEAIVADPAAGTATANPALDLLLQRRSHHVLQAPGPDDEELALIVQAALRVPDFQHLRPYRFLAARDEGLARLGLALQRGAIAAGKPEKTVARAPAMPQRAPLVVIAIASPRESKTVPVYDQELCAACTVLTMQLAARALGYSGVWRSGWPMYEATVHAELGLAPHERIVGYLYLGTPGDDDGHGLADAASQASARETGSDVRGRSGGNAGNESGKESGKKSASQADGESATAPLPADFLTWT